MRPFYLLLSVPFFLLVACSSPTTPPSIVTETILIPIVKQDFAQILGSNFRGQLYFEDDQAFFKGCGSEQIFAISSNEKLNNLYQQITRKNTVPVYIEFTGEIIFSKYLTDAPSALMRIDNVHHMAIGKTSLQCARPITASGLRAKGEVPYWRLSIEGQNLYFATKARNQVYQIDKANFQTTQMNSVQSINKQEQRLDLIIEPNDCFNLKENEYWGYTAKVTSILGEMQGCGEPGWPKLEYQFSGYYLNETPTKVSNLTLNPDYTVEYKEKTGEKTILKTGFWKNNMPDRVVVMLTQQTGKNIREEIVFKQTDLTLSSEQINQYNIVTNLDTPLVFKKMNIKEDQENSVPSIIRNFSPARIEPLAKLDLDIQKAVNQYFKIHRTDPQNTNFNAVKYDLNGDGIEEAIVLLDWCSASGCEMLIFEGGDKGYQFSSRVSQVNAPITIAKEQHFLWQSLLVDKNGQSLKLNFDGLSYPINATNLATANKDFESTGVVLFSQGRPQHWFPIKLYP